MGPEKKQRVCRYMLVCSLSTDKCIWYKWPLIDIEWRKGKQPWLTDIYKESVDSLLAQVRGKCIFRGETPWFYPESI